MTLTEIKSSEKDMLTPAEIADVLGSDAHTIRVTARQYPERIGFAYTFVGNRMKIPREAFIRWMEGGPK